MAHKYRLPKEVVVDLDELSLTIDGEQFPWYITEDGIDVIGLGDDRTLPEIHLAIPAQTVRVIPRSPRGEGGLDRQG